MCRLPHPASRFCASRAPAPTHARARTHPTPPCPPPRHASAAEELEKHFNLQHIDDSLGGAIPEAQLWSFEGYGERMQALDAAAAAAVQAAEEAVREGARLSPEEEALNAEFEKHVVVI